MAEFIYIEAIPIDGKIVTPHSPIKIPSPDEKPYISAISSDDAQEVQKEE